MSRDHDRRIGRLESERGRRDKPKPFYVTHREIGGDDDGSAALAMTEAEWVARYCAEQRPDQC